jgi:predicted TIM-barrel fold metal-dependent hydrolase
MPKIDAHHHLWDVKTNSYPGLSQYPKPTHPRVMCDTPKIGKLNFTLDAYREMSSPENVVKSVFIQAGMANPIDETRWVQKLSDDSGFPIMIVPCLDMVDPRWEETIESHLESPNVRAMRHIIADSNDPDGHAPDAFNDYVWQANYAKLAKYKMGFDMHVFPRQMDKAINIIGRNPDVPAAICHTGEPYDQSPNSVRLWKEGLAGLTPLILFAASPGTITGVITLSVAHSQHGIPMTARVAVIVAMAITWLIMILAAGKSGHQKQGLLHDVTTRFMGLIVLAMGVQFAHSGLAQFFDLVKS